MWKTESGSTPAGSINDLIQHMVKAGTVSTNDISDGYHTFGELYMHRITLFMALAKQTMCSWKSIMHSDGSVWDGWFILGIFKKHGEQITYHLPISEWGRCSFAETLDKAPEYDGHTSHDVLERINSLFL